MKHDLFIDSSGRTREKPDCWRRFLRMNGAWEDAARAKGHVPRLMVFPFAGGSCLTLRPFVSRLQSPVEIWGVEYPGRGMRAHETPTAQLNALVEEIVEGICRDDTPTLLLGYSFGALVAYEVALRLGAKSSSRVLGLVALSAKAPRFAARSFQAHRLSDPELIDYLRRLDGTAEEVLNNSSLMEQFLPAIRADLCAYETYEGADRLPLECPVVAVRGNADRFVEAAHALAWRDYGVPSKFRCHELPAGHFCHRDAPEDLSVLIDSIVSSLVRPYAEQFSAA